MQTQVSRIEENAIETGEPGPKVLIIDDDPNLLKAYRRVLSGEKLQVETASDGRQALGLWAKQRFDLIITDLRMPRFSGLSLIQQLRGSSDLPECPIVVLSGYIRDTDFMSIGHLDHLFFLEKPVGAPELIEVIRGVLENKRGNSTDEVSILGPLAWGARDTLQAMTGSEVVTLPPRLKAPGEPSGDISAMLTLSSTRLSGSIALTFSRADYLRFVSLCLKESCTELDSTNMDGIAETLSITFSQAKLSLNAKGLDLGLQLPVIRAEAAHSVKHALQMPIIVLKFASKAFGTCELEICTTSVA